MIVDLPQPEGPTIAVNLPFGTEMINFLKLGESLFLAQIHEKHFEVQYAYFQIKD